ncbi:MAG: hypothetical protein HQ515_10790, partial [Phycisphaeraceae bacterium]|nr:hypothetical protein [Phycisphaeraceae bacterium]
SSLYVSITADKDWQGRIVFDRPRHAAVMHLPLDWPRINQFPEWFTVQSGTDYVVQDCVTGHGQVYTGAGLYRGLEMSVKAGIQGQLRIESQVMQ